MSNSVIDTSSNVKSAIRYREHHRDPISLKSPNGGPDVLITDHSHQLAHSYLHSSNGTFNPTMIVEKNRQAKKKSDNKGNIKKHLDIIREFHKQIEEIDLRDVQKHSEYVNIDEADSFPSSISFRVNGKSTSIEDTGDSFGRKLVKEKDTSYKNVLAENQTITHENQTHISISTVSEEGHIVSDYSSGQEEFYSPSGYSNIGQPMGPGEKQNISGGKSKSLGQPSIRKEGTKKLADRFFSSRSSGKYKEEKINLSGNDTNQTTRVRESFKLDESNVYDTEDSQEFIPIDITEEATESNSNNTPPFKIRHYDIHPRSTRDGSITMSPDFPPSISKPLKCEPTYDTSLSAQYQQLQCDTEDDSHPKNPSMVKVVSSRTLPKGQNFLKRMKKKVSEAQIKKEMLAKMAEERELQECTFQPLINIGSSVVPKGSQANPNNEIDAEDIPKVTFNKETAAFEARREALIAQKRNLLNRKYKENQEIREQSFRNGRSRSTGLENKSEECFISHSSFSNPVTQKQMDNGNNESNRSPKNSLFSSQNETHSTYNLLDRSRSSVVMDPKYTFQPSITEKSRNVYKYGARKAEGSLDTFTRLYSRSLGFQAAHPEYELRLRKEEVVRQEFRRRHPEQGSMILSQGSPIQQFLKGHLDHVLPPSLAKELDALRLFSGAIRDSDVVQMSKESKISCPPHYMVPFLCNVIRIGHIDNIQVVDTEYTLNDNKENIFDVSKLCDKHRYFDPEAALDEALSYKPKKEPLSKLDPESFYMRQRTLLENKERKLKELTKALAPKGQPTLCKGTLLRQRSASCKKVSSIDGNDSNSRSHGSSLSVLAKPRELSKKHYDENLTFKPVISPFAATLITDNGVDRMYTEGKRREERMGQLREKALKNECATFKPKTNSDVNNSRYGGVQSMLSKENVNTSIYKKHLSRKRQLNEIKKEINDEKDEEEDFIECTFRPKINEVPLYITRMANSYSLLKEQQVHNRLWQHGY